MRIMYRIVWPASHVLASQIADLQLPHRMRILIILGHNICTPSAAIITVSLCYKCNKVAQPSGSYESQAVRRIVRVTRVYLSGCIWHDMIRMNIIAAELRELAHECDWRTSDVTQSQYECNLGKKMAEKKAATAAPPASATNKSNDGNQK